MVAALRWLLGARGAVRPGVLVSGGVAASAVAVVIALSTGSGAQPSNTMYVRAAATGDGSGSDWANACADFTGSCAAATLKRGWTYYVAAGNYGSRTFNPTVGGSTTINIKGATAADHGGDTGWVTTYSVGASSRQAHFAYPLNWGGAQYITFDGNTACGRALGAACGTPSTYGFIVDSPANCNQDLNYNDMESPSGGTVQFVTWAHTATDATCAGTANSVSRIGWANDFQTETQQNLTWSYDYCAYMEGCIELRRKSGSGITISNFLIDRLWVDKEWSDGTHHGDQINMTDHVDVVTVRYSVFTAYSVNDGTAVVTSNDSSGQTLPCVNHLDVYGSVFIGSQAGNGTIASTSACNIVNSTVCNNTFSGNVAGFGWFYTSTGTNNIGRSNLIYNQPGTVGANVTHDYNSFFNATSIPSETHGQTSATNPFVNTATGDYHLAADTATLDTTGCPAGNSLDPDGVTRTSSRGAYQFTP